MKHLIILLLCGLVNERSLSQSNEPKLILGEYEGIEIRYYRHVDDTSTRVDRMNKLWGLKKLTLDSNGTFLLEFPVPYPTSRRCPPRVTRGRWARIKDTLVLNSHYQYGDFMRVRERKVKTDRVQVKLKYTYEGKFYYPSLEISINEQKGLMSDTRHPWTYFPLDTVRVLEIKKYAGPISSEREWIYYPTRKNSNYFVISLIDHIEGNNFVVKDYKLLIVDSSLIQIDRLFNLSENRYKVTNPVNRGSRDSAL